MKTTIERPNTKSAEQSSKSHTQKRQPEKDGITAAYLPPIHRQADPSAPPDSAQTAVNFQKAFSRGSSLPASASVQRAEEPGAPPHWNDPAVVHQAANVGTRGPGGPLPFLQTIQRAFGRHDVSHVQAHTGPAATAGAHAMGAKAFTTGNHVAFAGTPDLHTTAHEAAHVVQQQAGVRLKSGVGQVEDSYERHADTVADRVVEGRSAADLLDAVGPKNSEANAATGNSVSATAPVQREVYTKWIYADFKKELTKRNLQSKPATRGELLEKFFDRHSALNFHSETECLEKFDEFLEPRQPPKPGSQEEADEKEYIPVEALYRNYKAPK